MLSMPVGGEVYVLDEASAAGLVERLRASTPLLESGEPEPGTTLSKLRDAINAREPAALDEADLALILIELEAWALEVDGDLPDDAHELRSAIGERLG
jgi:hypothetical protein